MHGSILLLFLKNMYHTHIQLGSHFITEIHLQLYDPIAGWQNRIKHVDASRLQKKRCLKDSCASLCERFFFGNAEVGRTQTEAGHLDLLEL